MDLHGYPHLTGEPQALSWLGTVRDLGAARNTILAYASALNTFLGWCARESLTSLTVRRPEVARYINTLGETPRPNGRVGFANKTLQLHATVLRLYFDYLVQEEARITSPIRRGVFRPGRDWTRERGLVRREERLPWIPTEEQFGRILAATTASSLRTRLMFAIAYDCALRRGELVQLAIADFDPAHRMLTVRAETSKARRGRVVPYAAETDALLRLYLRQRRMMRAESGALFLSESHRNYASPISIWSWTKVVEAIAADASVPEFTTHTFRHLCLTDLARAGWDVQAIRAFAGHRALSSTMQYIHLSGRDLARQVAASARTIHAIRQGYVAKALAVRS